MTPAGTSARQRRDAAYAALRAREGRGAGGDAELFALPFLSQGPLAPQWRVRARTFLAFLSRVVVPLERERRRPLLAADLGAGNGWLAGRLAARGHRAVALDVRLDAVDGLAAGAPLAARHAPRLARVAGTFESAPLQGGVFDLVAFDASLHDASSLDAPLAEAARLAAPGARIAILDSPFYARETDGRAMVEERRRATRERLADLADDLLALPGVDFLTRERLARVARPLGLSFRRRRVLYPLAYEWRPVAARLRRARPPSRFDLWVAVAP